jgi:hypothetical protein
MQLVGVKRRIAFMHFFSAQQDWNSERVEFGVCLIITSYHLTNARSGIIWLTKQAEQEFQALAN